MKAEQCECLKTAGDQRGPLASSGRMIIYDQPPTRTKRIIEQQLHPGDGHSHDWTCHGRNWVLADTVRSIFPNRAGRTEPITYQRHIKGLD